MKTGYLTGKISKSAEHGIGCCWLLVECCRLNVAGSARASPVEASHFARRGAMPRASGARLTLFWSNMRALSHEVAKIVSFPLPLFFGSQNTKFYRSKGRKLRGVGRGTTKTRGWRMEGENGEFLILSFELKFPDSPPRHSLLPLFFF